MEALFISIIAVLFCAIFIAFARTLLVAMKAKNQSIDDRHFFLPVSFFSSLTILASFWVFLLVILGSRHLVKEQMIIVVVVTTLFAPFLSWWRKKKTGENS